MSITDEDRKEILNLWENQHMSVAEISKKTQMSEATIRRSLKAAGIRLKNMGYGLKFSEEQKKFIIQKYNEGVSTVSIGKHFGVCDRTIATYLRKWGVSIRRSGYAPKIINENFFETIDNEIKAYFLGLLMADGCIISGNVLSLSLAYPDEYLIQELIENVGYYQPVVKEDEQLKIEYRLKRLTKSVRGNRTAMFSAMMHSTKICEDLKKYGMVPRKSLMLAFPSNIQQAYIRHFIRGFFDGNGSVYFSKGSIHVSIYSQPSFLKEIQRNFEEIGISHLSIYSQKKEQISFISYSKKSDINAIYHYFYDDATIFMKRKKEKFAL